MSETTTTTTTPAAAPAKKPKRPKSKSMIMASEQLKKAFSDTQEAKARGEMIGWATSLFPQEIPEAFCRSCRTESNRSFPGLCRRCPWM